ncbi:hypothetical protein F4819DRAFT_101062 [Hypoxylon fuscum]|nr:hypothetical protein F4819DRAFT_101062 [Hypoxylon fuscum]
MPNLAFDDLCRAALETGKLHAIKSAAFATDTETMWGLFSTLLNHVRGQTHSKKKKGEATRGINLTLHKVENTIFMKLLNPYAANDLDTMTATTCFKKDGLKWCWTMENHPDRSAMTNTFKRVTKFDLCDISMVIEDGDRILPTRHECKKLDGNDLQQTNDWD